MSQRSAKCGSEIPRTDPKMSQIGRSATIMGPQGGTQTAKTALESSQGRHGVHQREPRGRPGQIVCKCWCPKREPKATKMGVQNGLIFGHFFECSVTSIWRVLGIQNRTELDNVDDQRDSAQSKCT